MKKIFNLKNIRTCLGVVEVGLSLLNIIITTREIIKKVKKNKNEEVVDDIKDGLYNTGNSKFAELTIDNIVK